MSEQEKEKKPVRLGREGTNEVPYPSFGEKTVGIGHREIPNFGERSLGIGQKEFPSFMGKSTGLNGKEFPSFAGRTVEVGKKEFPSFEGVRGELPSLLGSRDETGSKKRREFPSLIRD